MNYQELYRNTLAVAKGAIAEKWKSDAERYGMHHDPTPEQINAEFSRRYDLQCAKAKEGVTR